MWKLCFSRRQIKEKATTTKKLVSFCFQHVVVIKFRWKIKKRRTTLSIDWMAQSDANGEHTFFSEWTFFVVDLCMCGYVESYTVDRFRRAFMSRETAINKNNQFFVLFQMFLESITIECVCFQQWLFVLKSKMWFFALVISHRCSAAAGAVAVCKDELHFATCFRVVDNFQSKYMLSVAQNDVIRRFRWRDSKYSDWGAIANEHTCQ